MGIRGRYCFIVPVCDSAIYSYFCPGDEESIVLRTWSDPPASAGKDRTGVLAALILALTYTPRAGIAHDYMLTRIGVEPYREYLFKVLFGMKIEAAEGTLGQPGMLEMCETRPTSILGFLDWMDERWGDVAGEQRPEKQDDVEVFPGVHGWLIKEMGFAKDDLERIRSNLGVVSR